MDYLIFFAWWHLASLYFVWLYLSVLYHFDSPYPSSRFVAASVVLQSLVLYNQNYLDYNFCFQRNLPLLKIALLSYYNHLHRIHQVLSHLLLWLLIRLLIFLILFVLLIFLIFLSYQFNHPHSSW